MINGLSVSARRGAGLAAFAIALALAGCGGSSDTANTPGTGATGTAAATALSPLAQLGEQIFHDSALSASGRQSCGTCHVETRAFTADPATDAGLPVPLGGPNMDLPGFRNAPSLMYASFTPPFSLGSDNTATGGFFRDGRASSLAVQAQQPFLLSFEMANASPDALAQRLRGSANTLQQFVALYGDGALSNPQTVLEDMGLAIAAYETEAPEFHPFSSKYDFWLQGQAQLSTQEQRGLALFNDPSKGNCTACHPSQRQAYSSHALFTDFTYDDIGVPRNWAIPANAVTPVSPIDGVSLASYMPAPVNVPADAEYAFYDLGLCGPFGPSSLDPNPRPLLEATKALCGQFKVPTLRNVAVTAPYFHNGSFSTLKQVVEWYVTRDINNNAGNNPNPVPAGPGGNAYLAIGSFYTAADGSPDLYEYNDLPVTYDANVNIGEVPYTPPTFGGGQAPTLTSDEIYALVAFLCTLTDGFDPNNPAAYALPAQCSPSSLTESTQP
jgi:cytochrome c peroxidase